MAPRVGAAISIPTSTRLFWCPVPIYVNPSEASQKAVDAASSHLAARRKAGAYRQAICDGLYQAMRETLNLPEDDQFMVITERDAGNFHYANTFGITRSDDLVYVQTTVFNTRTLEQKTALFRRIAELLGNNPGIRGGDVFVNVLEAAKENWSVGLGLSQFA